MGVNFGDPRRFVDPTVHTHNPIFFELASLNALNDSIFARFGTSFGAFEWMPTNLQMRTNEFARAIGSMMADEFGDAPLVGLKDPRFCFTLPIWRRALRSLGYAISYVVTHRSPHAVLASNQVVNGLPAETNFRLVALSDLLSRRFLEGETGVVHVSYEDLTAAPESTCAALASALRMVPSTAASAAIDQSLTHHR